MNKEQLIEILQSCLLYFEGMSQEELIDLMNHENVFIGIKMCDFLKQKVNSSFEVET